MKKELALIIEEIQGRNILVIGDMVADIYLDGRISRISRDRKSTRLNSSHLKLSRMPSSA